MFPAETVMQQRTLNSTYEAVFTETLLSGCGVKIPDPSNKQYYSIA